jgi:hypothetical protein
MILKKKLIDLGFFCKEKRLDKRLIILVMLPNPRLFVIYLSSQTLNKNKEVFPHKVLFPLI